LAAGLRHCQLRLQTAFTVPTWQLAFAIANRACRPPSPFRLGSWPSPLPVALADCLHRSDLATRTLSIRQNARADLGIAKAVMKGCGLFGACAVSHWENATALRKMNRCGLRLDCVSVYDA